jgi:hypothetical protein
MEKWKQGRGYGQNNRLLPPLPHDTEQRRGGQGGRPVEGGGAPATRCTATAGKWGKPKRSLRATDSAPYPGLGCSGEADRRTAVGLLAVVAGAALVVAMKGSERRGNWCYKNNTSKCMHKDELVI